MISCFPVLEQALKDALTDPGFTWDATHDMPTLVLGRTQLLEVALRLRDDPAWAFDSLMDVCGVDYLHYGMTEWPTTEATGTGFSRATTPLARQKSTWGKPRFAVVYHLLSVAHNHRMRLKVYLNEADLQVPTLVPVWASANWFEREVYDLFGIAFEGHPDLRRILTDYGFKGHPLRKDFPLIGEVEMRYDATLGRCVYEPVSIQPRVQVPKVIRNDERYQPDLSGQPQPAAAQGEADA